MAIIKERIKRTIGSVIAVITFVEDVKIVFWICWKAWWVSVSICIM